MNILVVEDDRFMRGMLFQMMNHIGKHDVSFVTNGHNAVSLLGDPSHGFDLVFIDLHMPRLTGDKVIQIVQDIVHTNFVVVTGHPQAFQNPPKHVQFIRKPFDYNVIEGIIAETEKKLKAKKAGGKTVAPELSQSGTKL